MNESAGLHAPKRALLSAWRKDGLVEFGKSLHTMGVEIVSTGGTARSLREAGVAVQDVSELTGFPEMLDGRVKTLHPKVHGGLLFRRDHSDHVATAARHGILPIDIVYVDLYPFEEVSVRAGVPDAELIEMIDIGGPAMIRSAAKNHAHVLVLTDPSDLELALTELRANHAASTLAFRRHAAAKAFRRTAAYDAIVSQRLTEEAFPERMVFAFERREIGRYGENPHQPGAIYSRLPAVPNSAARARQLSGKEISYNNFLDASAAFDVVRGQTDPVCAIIKHRNPCGAARRREGIVAAFHAAYEGDPLSAFGGILALNRPFDETLAREVGQSTRFFEVIIAPSFVPAAVGFLQGAVKWGKSVRLLEVGGEGAPLAAPGLELRSIDGGVLVQERDVALDPERTLVTSRGPTERERADLEFAWDVCRHVTSNAIVFVRDQAVVGVGAGQMSRVDSVEIAAKKAGAKAQGAAMASDAFFPFADGLQAGAKAGVTAVIQPGGSVRDAEIIAAANAAGLAMVFTGRRHFRH